MSKDLNGELLIVPLASEIEGMEEEMFTLNETGQAIWRRLDGRISLKEVARSLAREFDAPVELIEADIVEFASELLKKGVIIEIAGD